MTASPQSARELARRITDEAERKHGFFKADDGEVLTLARAVLSAPETDARPDKRLALIVDEIIDAVREAEALSASGVPAYPNAYGIALRIMEKYRCPDFDAPETDAAGGETVTSEDRQIAIAREMNARLDADAAEWKGEVLEIKGAPMTPRAPHTDLDDILDDPDHRSSVCDALLYPGEGKPCDCGRDAALVKAQAEVDAMRAQNATLGSLYALMDSAVTVGGFDDNALVAVDARALATVMHAIKATLRDPGAESA